MKCIGAVQREELGIGGSVAYSQVATMHVRQGVPRHIKRVLGATSHNRKANESKDEQHAQADADPHGSPSHPDDLAKLCAQISSGHNFREILLFYYLSVFRRLCR